MKDYRRFLTGFLALLLALFMAGCGGGKAGDAGGKRLVCHFFETAI